jgi:TolA-binding protein
MATVMLLVVAIGLWYVPGRGSEQAVDNAGEVVVNPDPQGEAAPSTLARAPETASETEPQPGESTEARGAADEAEEQTAQPDESEAKKKVAKQVDSEQAEADRDRKKKRLRARSPARRRQARVEEPKGVPKKESASRTRGAEQSAAGEDSALFGQRRAAAPSSKGEAAGGSAGAELQADSVQRARPNDEQAAPGTRQTYRRGLEHYRNKQYTQAIEALSRVVQSPTSDARSLVPGALHYLARSHRAKGSCGEAAPHYESLLGRFSDYDEAPRAMLELGDCYRRMDQLEQATRWLKRAKQHDETKELAERGLERVRRIRTERRRNQPSMMEGPSESY